jgi:hypothetical protein
VARLLLLFALAAIAVAGAWVTAIGAWLGYGVLLSTPAAPLFAALPPVASLLAFGGLLKLADAGAE